MDPTKDLPKAPWILRGLQLDLMAAGWQAAPLSSKTIHDINRPQAEPETVLFSHSKLSHRSYAPRSHRGSEAPYPAQRPSWVARALCPSLVSLQGLRLALPFSSTTCRLRN